MVILNKLETKVLAVGNKWQELKEQLKEKGVEKTKYVIHGPIEKEGSINIYLSRSSSLAGQVFSEF